LSRQYIIWLALRSILLALVGSMVMACATSNGPIGFQQPEEPRAKSVLKTCAVVQDQELAEMRGCYDVYSFAMNIKGDLDLMAKNFSIQTNFTQVNSADQIPANLKVNDTGTQVAFNNGSVSYSAGIGQNSISNGIHQIIQVAGSNVIVVATMDVTLNINNAVGLKPTAGSLLPSTMSGMVR
jgi:hypothetical protein